MPLRRIDRVPAVLLRPVGGFVEELEDRLTSFIELSLVVTQAVRPRKWNHSGTHCRCFSLSAKFLLPPIPPLRDAACDPRSRPSSEAVSKIGTTATFRRDALLRDL
jgi:hypothetical protein